MAVVVPPGVGPGHILQLVTPGGKQFACTVPQGIVSGQHFMIALPAVYELELDELLIFGRIQYSCNHL